jgi:hypothetical protein
MKQLYRFMVKILKKKFVFFLNKNIYYFNIFLNKKQILSLSQTPFNNKTFYFLKKLHNDTTY